MRTTIKGFVLHCSAGFGDIYAIQKFWQEDLKWKSKGYAVFIETNGTKWWLVDNVAKHGYSNNYNEKCWELITNGVAGYNTHYVHICYQGGIEIVNKKIVAKDTRTPEQFKATHDVIQLGKKYFTEKRKFDLTKDFSVWGHFDFSPDKDGSGVIEGWERIKECPSFVCMQSEFHTIYSSADRIGTLPYNKPIKETTRNKTVTHVVVSGDTLYKIAQQYKTTIENIKAVNGLRSDFLIKGQRLIVAIIKI